MKKPKSPYAFQRYWLLHEALRLRVAGGASGAKGRKQVQRDMAKARRERSEHL